MKRIFAILLVLFSSLFLSCAVLAQDEEIDDEFFEDEPIIDPLDEPIAAPPTWEADDSGAAAPSPRPNFPRPSGGYQGPGGSGGSFTNPGTEIVFKLVNPTAVKRTKPPLRVPARIRKKVEDNVRREERLQKQ